MLDRGNTLRNSGGKKVILIVALVVLFLGLAGAAGYFAWQTINLKSHPNAAAEETTKRLKAEVGKLYALPTDEEPTIAQVQDKEKLKDQQFFSKAENGDYILIYTNAKLALLYREKSNLLINVGPITISDNNQTSSQPASSTPAQNSSSNNKP